MSRIKSSETTVNSLNDSKRKSRRPSFVNNLSRRGGALVVAAFLGTAALAASSIAAETQPKVVASVEQKDPLTGDTWHAVDSTWPGTLVFDAENKTVALTPVGATPMEASYTYTVKPSTSKDVVEGTLRMTNTAGQVSDATFRVDGKKLTLSYAAGQRPEQFVRMSPKEEEAEMARLNKLISEGRIRPLK